MKRKSRAEKLEDLRYTSYANWTERDGLWLLAEVDRLREALKLIAAPKRADGTYNRCREACEQLAREALGEEM